MKKFTKQKATLYSAMFEARDKAGLTMYDAAAKCGIAETTVWKAENGRTVRWETIHLILTVALCIRQDTAEYQRFKELWMLTREQIAKNRPIDKGVKKLPPHAAAAIRVFRNIIRDMDEHTLEELMRSVDRAVVRIFKDP